MWVNLLPNGTRTVELCSGYAMLVSSILMYLGILTAVPQLSTFESSLTWDILLFIFGTLQVFSIYKTPSLDTLRTIMSWITGCFWTWISVTSIGNNLGIDDTAALLLGIGNFYGFIINVNILHIPWTE